MTNRFARWGRPGWISYNVNNPSRCIDCQVDCTPKDRRGRAVGQWEYFMLRDSVWAATGLDRHGGYLCIGCVESRLGRALAGTDFSDMPINWIIFDNATPRLKALLADKFRIRAFPFATAP